MKMKEWFKAEKDAREYSGGISQIFDIIMKLNFFTSTPHLFVYFYINTRPKI